MNVLVAGAAGAIGAPVVRALVAAGHTVTGTSRSPSRAGLIRQLGAEPLVMDALERSSVLEAVHGRHFDAVIGLLTALPAAGPLRDRDMVLTNRLRDEGTANLVEAARRTGARRVLAESMMLVYGFGDHGSRPVTEDRPPATTVPRPGLTPVLDALRALERHLFAPGGPEGIALRFGLLYGPGTGTEEMVRLLRRRSMPAFGDRSSVAPWVHIDDAAGATVAALERGSPGEAYNIGADPVAFGDFLTTLAEVSGTPRPLRVPRWLLRPFAPFAVSAMADTSIRLDTTKARRELGWSPAYPTHREGLEASAATLRRA